MHTSQRCVYCTLSGVQIPFVPNPVGSKWFGSWGAKSWTHCLFEQVFDVLCRMSFKLLRKRKWIPWTKGRCIEVAILRILASSHLQQDTFQCHVIGVRVGAYLPRSISGASCRIHCLCHSRVVRYTAGSRTKKVELGALGSGKFLAQKRQFWVALGGAMGCLTKIIHTHKWRNL